MESAFIKKILNEYPNFERIVVFSRDELKQFEMQTSDDFKDHLKKLRFFIGNVRDGERLKTACEGIDVIVHAAALKQCLRQNIIL